MTKIIKGWDFDKYNNDSKKLLEDKDLFEIIINEIGKKVINEEQIKKTILLNLCGIFVKNCSKEKNNLIIEGQSSIGKSWITGRVLDIFPNDLFIWRTRISPTALTYWHQDDFNWTWDGKILYLEDVSNDVLNSEVLKVMLSEGSKAEITVDGHKTKTIEVKGKPLVILTSARANPNAEILNRLDSVEIEGKKDQLIKIREYQAKTAKRGYGLEYEPIIVNAFTLLNPINVRIPFADELPKLFPDAIEINRIFPRFLNLIRNSCALHQYQRKQDEDGYYLAESQDLELAIEIIKYMHQYKVIGLSRILMKKYEKIKEWNENNGWFTVEEIHSKFPIVALQNWYRAIDIFAEKGLLESRLDVTDIYNKRTQWRLVKKQEIQIDINGFNSFNINNSVNNINNFEVNKEKFV